MFSLLAVELGSLFHFAGGKLILHLCWLASLVAQTGKNSPATWKTWVWSLGWEGNGDPLQYSCMENSKDRGAWKAIVHGLQRVGHQWMNNTSLHLCWRHMDQPSQKQRVLVQDSLSSSTGDLGNGITTAATYWPQDGFRELLFVWPILSWLYLDDLSDLTFQWLTAWTPREQAVTAPILFLKEIQLTTVSKDQAGTSFNPLGSNPLSNECLGRILGWINTLSFFKAALSHPIHPLIGQCDIL